MDAAFDAMPGDLLLFLVGNRTEVRDMEKDPFKGYRWTFEG